MNNDPSAASDATAAASDATAAASDATAAASDATAAAPDANTAAPASTRPEGGSGVMFDRIATRYDLLNRIMSLGIDQSWRRKTVDALGLSSGSRALDLATGTGDLAVMITRRTSAHVTGVDPSVGMLRVGEQKVRDLGLAERIELREGDAQRLPFEDDSFDGTTIAFGIRNVPDREKALCEMARVTKPGGKVAVLELSEPRGSLMAPLAKFHVHHLVPWVGSLLSGSREYRYLQRSIAAFPTAEEFGQTISSCNLEVLRVEALTFGVAHLYVATPRSTAGSAEVPTNRETAPTSR